MRIDRNPTQLVSQGLNGAVEPGVGSLVECSVRVIPPCVSARVSHAASGFVAASRIHGQGSAMSLKWARREAGR
jgi:hypothetical protein